MAADGGGLGTKHALDNKVVLTDSERIEKHLREMCNHPMYNGLPFEQVLSDSLAPKFEGDGRNLWGFGGIL